MRRHGWTMTRAAAALASGVAMLFANVLPALTGVLARNLGFSIEVLGTLSTASMLGSTAGSVWAVALTRFLSPRALLLSGMLIYTVCNVANAFMASAFQMIVIAAIAGLGTGLAVAACFYVFGLEEQEKNKAAGMLAQTAVATVVITAIPALSSMFGWQAMYWLFAACALPCFALAAYFPKAYVREAKDDRSDSNPVVPPDYWPLGAVVLSVIPSIMIWAYLDRMGVQAGIPQTTINRALSLSTLLGMLSSLLVIWHGRRISAPYILGICTLCNVAGILATGSSVPLVYFAGVVTFYFTLPLFLAGQFGIVMRGVASKQFAVKYSMVMHTAALGPLLGGYLAKLYGFDVVRAVAMSMMLLSFCILWSAIVRQGRRSAQSAWNADPVMSKAEPNGRSSS